MVRKFDTLVAEFYSSSDLERIAKEMVNIYHGKKYYDTDKDDAPLVDNPKEDYLIFEESGITTKITPSRGYIYIHTSKNVWDLNIKYDQLKVLLNAEFNKFNIWGIRPYQAVFNNACALQYTYELRKTESTENTIYITETNDPFNSKMSGATMTWYYSTQKSLFKYTIPGETRKPYQIMAAASTIIVDLAHLIKLPNNYYSLSMPTLPIENVLVLKNTINLSKRCGADMHLYLKMCKDINLYKPLTRQIVDTVNLKKDKKENLLYAACSTMDNPNLRTDIWEVDASQITIPTTCLLCSSELWEQNYLIIAKNTKAYKKIAVAKRGRGNKKDNNKNSESESEEEKVNKKVDAKANAKNTKEKIYDRPNAAVICRFCIHYQCKTYNINKDTNVKEIRVVDSALSRNIIINKYITDENEKMILGRITKNINNKTLIFSDKTPELNNQNMCHIMGDNGLLFGVPHYVDLGDCAEFLLEYALKLGEKVYVFKYTKYD
jgi:hypothetical protein